MTSIQISSSLLELTVWKTDSITVIHAEMGGLGLICVHAVGAQNSDFGIKVAGRLKFSFEG